LIGLDRAGQNIGLGFGIIEVDLRGGALADQIAIAPDIALRALELGLILGEHALGLLDLGVDLTRVEGKQQIAFIDLAPSSKWTETMVVSTRDFSATLEIGVTVPIESTSTGTGLRSALASFDRDHARALRSLGTGAAARPGRARHEGGQSNEAQPACQNDQVTLFS